MGDTERKVLGKLDSLSFEALGEAMRPENLRGEAFRLSREERDHIAGHALTALCSLAVDLAYFTRSNEERSQSLPQASMDGSDAASKIAALSNLLGDIGWERVGGSQEAVSPEEMPKWILGELFPVAQLRPWLKDWQRQDNEALRGSEELLELAEVDSSMSQETVRERVSDAQTKLGTGAILWARIEKWMASHGN